MRRLMVVLCLFMLATGATLPAQAAVMTYQVEATAPDTQSHTYTYRLSGEFDAGSMLNLLFGAGSYANVSLDWSSLSGLNAGWLPLDGAIEPLPGLPADGILQLLALSPIHESGASFRVDFDWTGTGLPGAQAFELIDSMGNLAQTGTTTLFVPTDPGQVPEPGTALLMLGGALFLVRHARRRPLS